MVSYLSDLHRETPEMKVLPRKLEVDDIVGRARQLDPVDDFLFCSAFIPDERFPEIQSAVHAVEQLLELFGPVSVVDDEDMSELRERLELDVPGRCGLQLGQGLRERLEVGRGADVRNEDERADPDQLECRDLIQTSYYSLTQPTPP